MKFKNLTCFEDQTRHFAPLIRYRYRVRTRTNVNFIYLTNFELGAASSEPTLENWEKTGTTIRSFRNTAPVVLAGPSTIF